MKKNENKKFSLEKFEVAKLNKLKTIKGGGDNVNILTSDETNTNNNSGGGCRKVLVIY
jgi:hypothetical protein